MANALSRFTIQPADDQIFLIRIESEDGEPLEVTATFEQLDLIQEAIDEQLDEDFEDVDAVDE